MTGLTSRASAGNSGTGPDEAQVQPLEAWKQRSDPRVPAYLVGGFGALVLAIVTGQAALAALGAPLIALAAIGLLDGDRAPDVSGVVRLERDRAVEGDVLDGEVHLEWDGVADVEIILAGMRGIEPVEPEPVVGWRLEGASGPVTLPFSVRTRSWGVQTLGALWVRIRRPGSYALQEHRLTDTPTVRVLPTAQRLGRLLKPAEPRAVAGMHVARFRGQGSDFAEFRPYRPGDRLRDLSWGTSARLGVPWVRVNHPERTGTVVLLLDAIFQDEEGKGEALARAARATWAVASLHLRAQDRVGLLARGRTAAWLPPRGGRRARWMLLDELLSIGRAVEDPSRRRLPTQRVTIPSDALIVGVTSLRSERFASALLHYRRTGHATASLVIDTMDLVPQQGGPVDEAARRIFLTQRDTIRRSLDRGGVPTALITAEGGPGAAILSLRRRMNAMHPPTRGAMAR